MFHGFVSISPVYVVVNIMCNDKNIEGNLGYRPRFLKQMRIFVKLVITYTFYNNIFLMFCH